MRHMKSQVEAPADNGQTSSRSGKLNANRFSQKCGDTQWNFRARIERKSNVSNAIGKLLQGLRLAVAGTDVDDAGLK